MDLEVIFPTNLAKKIFHLPLPGLFSIRNKWWRNTEFPTYYRKLRT